MPKTPLITRRSNELRTHAEQNRINTAALALVELMADMQWQDRDKGFDQWNDLVDALNARDADHV
jgi:hypothetical protein